MLIDALRRPSPQSYGAVAPAREPSQHAVSQVLLLEQDHDHKDDDHQPGHRQRLKQWSDNGLNRLQGFEIWPADFYRHRLRWLDRGCADAGAVVCRFCDLGFGLHQFPTQLLHQ
jgi:hypothetical protein